MENPEEDAEITEGEAESELETADAREAKHNDWLREYWAHGNG